jgi:GAF domain-containing protein
MKLAPIPLDEADRIADLYALKILDTPREPGFDRITELAADIFEVPMVFVTLVDSNRQWFKSTYGISLDSTPRDVSFCSHAMLEPEAMVIPDASEDPRFADNPFVTVPTRGTLERESAVSTSLTCECGVPYQPCTDPWRP